MTTTITTTQVEDRIRIVQRTFPDIDGSANYYGPQIIEVSPDEADRMADALHQLAVRVRRMQAERFGPKEYTIRDKPKPKPEAKPEAKPNRRQPWWRRVLG